MTAVMKKKAVKKAVRKAAKAASRLGQDDPNGFMAEWEQQVAENKPSLKEPGSGRLVITPPNFLTAEFKIKGDAPYVQNAFSQKAFNMIREAQEAGEAGKTKKKRTPKDFRECYEGSQHKSPAGWWGIPAPAFRNAMVSACRVAGYHMTKAKLCVFVFADGLDRDGTTPLVRLRKGKPKQVEHPVRLDKGGTDIRARAMFSPGWEAIVRIRYDADQFMLMDVAHLMMRVGIQVGVGEGRPDSPKSCGMGWGTFELIDK